VTLCNVRSSGEKVELVRRHEAFLITGVKMLHTERVPAAKTGLFLCVEGAAWLLLQTLAAAW